MGLRLGIARMVGAASEWVLKHVFRRPAANFPGKVGLYVDPQLIGELRSCLREGSIAVVGTNGKTTVTNLLADSIEAAGKTVACNRTGANLDSGVATALLQAGVADWGVLECDELWLAKVLPQLRPRFVVLLNLFRDQLDRMGEIDHIQASIASALATAPETTLIYNCDDPLCQAIADQVVNKRIPFGIDEELGLTQNTVNDADMCQHCESPLEYRWRQYGQLGAYRCPNCGFARAEPAFAAYDVDLTSSGVALSVCGGATRSVHQKRSVAHSVAHVRSTAPCNGDASEIRVQSHLAGAYMAYNLLAVCAAASCCGASPEAISSAIWAFTPENGRLQHYEIDGCHVLLNLAKNPTGFNQNLRIIEDEPGQKAVAFFINDKEADGHDVSWLWDVDFQELASTPDLLAFAGGIRRNDMQVRLKYAGIDAPLVEDAADFIAKALTTRPDAKLFLIANYTALPVVKAQLDHMSHLPEAISVQTFPETHFSPAFDQVENNEGESLYTNDAAGRCHDTCADGYTIFADGHDALADSRATSTDDPTVFADDRATLADSHAPSIVIAHMYPELLNLYGDGGNVTVLAQRARARGINVEVAHIKHGDTIDLTRADIVFLGGGPDREQRMASHDLIEQADELRAYVEDDGVLLAICGGYQILGHEWILGDQAVAGLGIIDIVTKRAEGGSHNRLVGNIALTSPIAHMPVIGYENHAGRTFIGSDCKPFGHVIGHCGHGNNDTDKADGVLYRNVIGTYLHGPLLAKNPEVADYLLEHALARRAERCGQTIRPLPPLNDATERAANEFMRNRLNVTR